MRTFLGVICKPPRQLQIFLAAYKIRHEIIFSWLLTSTAKVTLFLGGSILAAKKISGRQGNSILV